MIMLVDPNFNDVYLLPPPNRLLNNFLCLPHRLICLSRIDQTWRFAKYAFAGLIRVDWIA